MVSRQETELRSLEEENRRLKQAFGQADMERKDLSSRLQAVESERLSASRKLQSESQSLFQAQRSREALETQIEQLRCQLQQYEIANRELALSKAQVNRDLSRLDLDRKSLLDQLANCSRSQDQTTMTLVRDREERENMHLRHSRLLASVGIVERVKAAVRKRKGAGLSAIRDYIFKKYRKANAISLLDKTLYRRMRRLVRRRLISWKELCHRVRSEEYNQSLLQGHNLSLTKQAKFAWWQALTCRARGSQLIGGETASA
jgi:chromosome segregation ATPase